MTDLILFKHSISEKIPLCRPLSVVVAANDNDLNR